MTRTEGIKATGKDYCETYGFAWCFVKSGGETYVFTKSSGELRLFG